jgi:hypothetical protein
MSVEQDTFTPEATSEKAVILANDLLESSAKKIETERQTNNLSTRELIECFRVVDLARRKLPAYEPTNFTPEEMAVWLTHTDLYNQLYHYCEDMTEEELNDFKEIIDESVVALRENIQQRESLIRK